MSAYEPSTQDRTDTDLTDFDGRPDGCECSPTFRLLPCFACHQAGFETPNPNAEATE